MSAAVNGGKGLQAFKSDIVRWYTGWHALKEIRRCLKSCINLNPQKRRDLNYGKEVGANGKAFAERIISKERLWCANLWLILVEAETWETSGKQVLIGPTTGDRPKCPTWRGLHAPRFFWITALFQTDRQFRASVLKVWMPLLRGSKLRSDWTTHWTYFFGHFLGRSFRFRLVSLSVGLHNHILWLHLAEHGHRIKPRFYALELQLVVDLGDSHALNVDWTAVGLESDFLSLAALVKGMVKRRANRMW